jgi:cyclopropane fatty-acyl-phospholipid synthase-like methyltransferase
VSWDEEYAGGWAPWDIGRPQPAFVALAEAGEIVGSVLDSGCGTGENALMLAERGYEVVGVDIAPTAIERAQQKARDRGLTVDFQVGDVLQLDRLGRRFASVVDSGAFHTFDDHDRLAYVESVASVILDGGVVYLLCFSERVPGTSGPRRVTQAELRSSVSPGGDIERIDESWFEVKQDFFARRPPAWLARIVRREPKPASSR